MQSSRKTNDTFHVTRPGFPQRIQGTQKQEIDFFHKLNSDEYVSNHKINEEMEEKLSPQLSQQFQQQKLLEFIKRQQAEKILPFEKLSDTELQSSIYVQNMAALKLQQKQHYQDIVSSQYENHSIVENLQSKNSLESSDHDLQSEILISSQRYMEKILHPMSNNHIDYSGTRSEISSDTQSRELLKNDGKNLTENDFHDEIGDFHRQQPIYATTCQTEKLESAEEVEAQIGSDPKNKEKLDEDDIISNASETEGLIDLNSKLEKYQSLNKERPIENNTFMLNKAETTIRHEVGVELPKDSYFIEDHQNPFIEFLEEQDERAKNSRDSILDSCSLVTGIVFSARYLGSTQLLCDRKSNKSKRMLQAEEAVSRIKAPEGENQPGSDVDLFISVEKIMILNKELKETLMEHPLKTISYIADIGDLLVLMARRHHGQEESENNIRASKIMCHVFECEEAQFIAQSIGQAFQVAYSEYLKASGKEEFSLKKRDYQEVLNSQKIQGGELEFFAKKELQKEIVVPKAKGEILGVVIVESGWGSMLPTVVITNLASNGAAARCGQLNIGDQIIAINGLSLVGLPLSQCQTYIKNTKNQTVVKFTVVPCAPVVEVKIKRPNTKYQLGFSVQNGVICSLLRGGIAERGGVRVGHRIIEINNQSVVAVPHEKIVKLLATSVGEIMMKTMPKSMFRLLTGQENPIFI